MCKSIQPPPFSAITAARLLGYVYTTFVHPETEIFASSSLRNSPNSVRLDGEHSWTTGFLDLARDFQLDLGLDLNGLSHSTHKYVSF